MSKLSAKHYLRDVSTVIIITTRLPNDLELKYLIEDLFHPGEFTKVVNTPGSELHITHQDQRVRLWPKSFKGYTTTLYIMDLLEKADPTTFQDSTRYLGDITVIAWNPLLNKLHEFTTINQNTQVIIFDYQGLPKRTTEWNTVKRFFSYTNEFSSDPYKSYYRRKKAGEWLVVRFPLYDSFRKPKTSVEPITKTFIPVQTTRDESFIKVVETAKLMLVPRVGKDIFGIILMFLEKYRREWSLPKWYQKEIEISGSVPMEPKDTRFMKK